MRDGQIEVKIRESDNKTILHIIIKYVVDNKKYVPCTENKVIKPLSSPLVISSYLVLVTSTYQHVNTINTSKEFLFRMLTIQESLSINCLFTTYVVLCLNGKEITRVDLFNGVRLLYI